MGDNKQQNRGQQGGQAAQAPGGGDYHVTTVYTSPNETPEAQRVKIEALLNEQARTGHSFVCWWPHPFDMGNIQAVFRKNEK